MSYLLEKPLNQSYMGYALHPASLAEVARRRHLVCPPHTNCPARTNPAQIFLQIRHLFKVRYNMLLLISKIRTMIVLFTLFRFPVILFQIYDSIYCAIIIEYQTSCTSFLINHHRCYSLSLVIRVHTLSRTRRRLFLFYGKGDSHVISQHQLPIKRQNLKAK